MQDICEPISERHYTKAQFTGTEKLYLAIIPNIYEYKLKQEWPYVAHCAQNSKLWKKVYIYTLKCHMEVNKTILKVPYSQ